MVKKGYKQTEIGVIPEDWEVKRLGDIGEPKMCKRIFKNQTKKSGDIPFYKIGTFGKKADAFISKDMYEEYKNKFPYPKKGEILISASGTIGKTVVYNGENAYYQDSNIVWITNNEKLIKNNLLYYYYQIIKWTTENTTISRLYNDILKEIKIPIPQKPEQEKIAKVLSDTDELIENLKELITKKEDIKKATMQQLLTGKKQLKGFSGEWVKRNIKKFGTVITGATPPTNIQYYWNGNIPWITPTDITEQKNISISERMITSEGLKQIRTIPKNSILVTCIASIGKNAILTKEGACNQQINAIIPNDKFDYEFIYYLIELNKNYLIAKAGVTATPIISKYDFEQFEFYVPQDINEQKAIAKILSDMDEEIEALKEKLEKIKAIKQGMMQELLSGRIRLI